MTHNGKVHEFSFLLIYILQVKEIHVMEKGFYTARSELWRRYGIHDPVIRIITLFYPVALRPQRVPWPPHFLRFLDHTQRRTTVSRTPLDEWSARRTDLYLTTHNTHNRQTSMPPMGFEPTISAGERLRTYALDHAATGTGYYNMEPNKFIPGLV